MVVTFNEDYLEKLYSKGETGTKKICIEFTLEESDEEPVVTICNIMELSNHYK